ncbi:hypothetical protein IG631_00215 [Alternaria alternata]|nr:hypothetical protein IG631_00215 [Alternaria alternata]
MMDNSKAAKVDAEYWQSPLRRLLYARQYIMGGAPRLQHQYRHLQCFFSIKLKPLALEYPSVDVPGNAKQATPPVTLPQSPTSIFGTDLSGYSKSTLGTTPSRSWSNSRGGGLFSSFWS